MMAKAQRLKLDLGPITLALLRGLPPAYAGFLMQALAEYAETGKEPEKIAPRHLGAWIAAKEEFDMQARATAARSESARGGRGRKASADTAASLPGADWDAAVATEEESAATPSTAPAPAPVPAAVPSPAARPAASLAGRPAGSGQEELRRVWDKMEAEADSPYSVLLQVHDAMLPEFAAWVCREAGNVRAVGVHRASMRLIGPHRFRRCLEEFLGECATPGGEPANRGAALMARVKEEVSSVREVRA